MIKKINMTMDNIKRMGHTDEEYTQVFQLLNDSELALLERMEALHRMQDFELSMLHILINKIMAMLNKKFPKQSFSEVLTTC
ncbi:MAG: hypothetical protein HQL68_12105 [Magnetococcales bacterium]|nr:hypothetical protein [Magnetococcales bacterium]